MLNVTTTTDGLLALANEEEGGFIGRFSHIQFGSGRYTASSGQKALREPFPERYEINLNETSGGDIAVETPIDNVSGTPFEAGVFLDGDILIFIVTDPDEPLFTLFQGIDFLFSIDLSLFGEYLGPLDVGLSRIGQERFFEIMNLEVKELIQLEKNLRAEIG